MLTMTSPIRIESDIKRPQHERIGARVVGNAHRVCAVGQSPGLNEKHRRVRSAGALPDEFRFTRRS